MLVLIEFDGRMSEDVLVHVVTVVNETVNLIIRKRNLVNAHKQSFPRRWIAENSSVRHCFFISSKKSKFMSLSLLNVRQ